MKELKVGNYIRTKDKNGVQYIRKIMVLPDDTRYGSIVVDKDIHNVKWVSKKNVLKVSENIMDLIEENDLLNIEYYSPRYEERVTRLFEVNYRYGEYLSLKNAYCGFTLVNNEFRETDRRLEPIIKSIVTKEQFNSLKYEVK